MNTTEPVVEIRPEKNSRDLNPWPPRTGLNVSLLVQAARIAHIRFFTAMHIYDFNIFTVK